MKILLLALILISCKGQYEGTKEELPHVHGAINFANECTGKNFKFKDNNIKHTLVDGEKKIFGRWAFMLEGIGYVYGYMIFKNDKYNVFVSRDPVTKEVNETTRTHEYGHVVTYPTNPPHPKEYSHCFFNWIDHGLHVDETFYEYIEIDGNVIINTAISEEQI